MTHSDKWNAWLIACSIHILAGTSTTQVLAEAEDHTWEALTHAQKVLTTEQFIELPCGNTTKVFKSRLKS